MTKNKLDIIEEVIHRPLTIRGGYSLHEVTTAMGLWEKYILSDNKTPEEIEKIKIDLIEKHIEGWNNDLRGESIKYFAQSGKVSGSFFTALKQMLDDYVSNLRLNNAVENKID